MNGFLRDVAEFEREHPRVACFSPLSIDELPLVKLARSSDEREARVNFERPMRWDTADYYGSDEIMLAAQLPDSISLSNGDVLDAQGMIANDVAVRDYRLVRQSRALVVFNPWFNDRRSSGVDNEIEYAIDLRRPVHVFQDAEHDPRGECMDYLKGSVGALGGRPGREFITFHDSPRDALEAVLAG